MVGLKAETLNSSLMSVPYPPLLLPVVAVVAVVPRHFFVAAVSQPARAPRVVAPMPASVARPPSHVADVSGSWTSVAATCCCCLLDVAVADVVVVPRWVAAQLPQPRCRIGCNIGKIFQKKTGKN